MIIIAVCLFSTTKYHIRFNEERKFNELENVDISKSIDAKIIDQKLKGLRWITYISPEDPKNEIDNLIEAMRLFKKDKKIKMLITDYQFISPILDIYDNSPNQWHHPSVSFPLKGSKYFTYYQDYFISKIKKGKIETIYETSANNKTIISLLFREECFMKERVGKMLIKLELNLNCKELK
tara:strand:- start:386 stop:925 length:540 start_codon:yes stop_codon:yes gene_type:complete